VLFAFYSLGVYLFCNQLSICLLLPEARWDRHLWFELSLFWFVETIFGERPMICEVWKFFLYDSPFIISLKLESTLPTLILFRRLTKRLSDCLRHSVGCEYQFIGQKFFILYWYSAHAWQLTSITKKHGADSIEWCCYSPISSLQDRSNLRLLRTLP